MLHKHAFILYPRYLKTNFYVHNLNLEKNITLNLSKNSMKSIFDSVSFECSKNVTQSYSTSFSTAVKLLGPTIRQDIYNIYGFVRFADEIVDTFHDYNKVELFELFEKDPVLRWLAKAGECIHRKS